MKNKFMNITHKDDLDGLGCGIINKFFAEEIGTEFHLMELGYKDVDEKICEFINSGEYKNYKYITITDLGITKETAELIEKINCEEPKCTLIDHHVSNEFLNTYTWAHVHELDNFGNPCSATKHCLRFFGMNYGKYANYLNIFAEAVSDYDTYTWKERNNPLGKDMHDFMCLIGREEFRERIIMNIIRNENKEEPLIFSPEEKFVIEINKKKIRNYIDRKMKSLKFMKLQLRDGIILRAAVTIIDEKEYCSELGNYICENIPERADVAMMICPDAQDVSMRCVRNDINLAEDIARPLGGGGHKKSAGFRIKGIRDMVIADTIQKMLFGGLRLE